MKSNSSVSIAFNKHSHGRETYHAFHLPSHSPFPSLLLQDCRIGLVLDFTVSTHMTQSIATCLLYGCTGPTSPVGWKGRGQRACFLPVDVYRMYVGVILLT